MIDKPCSILISNRNSFEAIQLCVESVRRYTDTPRITVYDDCSTNGVDIEYLRKANEQGWLELIEGHKLGHYKEDFDKPRCGYYAIFFHGRALNILTASCTTRYAVILDCDVQILAPGWLDALIAPMTENPLALGVCDIWPKWIHDRYYVMPTYKFYFGALDMERYWDGMAVDWIPRAMDRREEPMLSLFAEWYPVKKHYPGRNLPKFEEDLVRGDPGSPIWLKLTYDNPKGYKILPWPVVARKACRHFTHGAINGDGFTYVDGEEARLKNKKFLKIRSELANLRQGDK